MKIKELPYPLDVSLGQYNVWTIVTDLESKTGVNLNDSQIKRCKTVGNLIDVFSSVTILSSKANMDKLGVNISSIQKSHSTNNSYSSNKGTSFDNNNTASYNRNAFEDSFDASNMSIEELFRLVKEPLNSTRLKIKKLKTGESKFDTVRMSFLDSLTSAINEADEQEDYLKQNLVLDHLVIAFLEKQMQAKVLSLIHSELFLTKKRDKKLLKKQIRSLYFLNRSF